jgi:hypothetical protein
MPGGLDPRIRSAQAWAPVHPPKLLSRQIIWNAGAVANPLVLLALEKTPRGMLTTQSNKLILSDPDGYERFTLSDAISDARGSQMDEQKRRAVRTLVRLPEDVKAWLRREAQRNVSTQSSEIVRAVRERMQSEVRSSASAS